MPHGVVLQSAPMELLLYAVAALTSFCASFIGTNTGGGALFVIPILLLLGLPPHIAVGSNRLSVVAMSLVGMSQFHREKKVRFDVGILVALFSGIGAYIGAHIMLALPEEILERFIGVLILIVLFLLLLFPKVGIHPRKSTVLQRAIGYPLFIIVGGVAAIIGGAGIFSRLIYTMFFGFTFSEASGTAKIATLSLSIVATAVFLSAGVVDFGFGAAMFLGGGLGSYLGSNVGLKKGDAWVRKLFLIVMFLLGLEMLL